MLQLICTSQRKVVIALLFLFTPLAHFTKCPNEHSHIYGIKTKAWWYSNASINNEIVISEPPCLDGSSNLITRVCKSGSWHPSTTPRCLKISKEETCPDNFQKVEDFCVNVTEPQKWSTNASLSSRKVTPSHSFWLPVRRTVKYGDFEYVEVGTNYGSKVHVDVDFKEYYSGDCVLFDAKTNRLKVENCSSSHPVVRYFERNSPLYDCPPGCLATNSDFQCFCKSNNCKNLAVVRTTNDRQILRTLVGEDVCRISGLGENSLSFLNGSLWQSGNVTTNCSICQVNARSSLATKMVLSFEEKKKDLYLLVYSPEDVKHDDDDEPLIFCFTNAAKTKLKAKCETDLVLKVLSSADYPESFYVYEVETERYMGEYWCEAFFQTNTLLKSEKVIAYERKQGNEYALRVVAEKVCKHYSCDLVDVYKQLIKELKEPLDAEIRVMEVFNFDIYNDVLDVLLHVSTRKDLDVTKEYSLMWGVLTKHPLEVKFFRSSEYCLPETLILNNTKLHWPLTSINNVVVSEELCLQEDGTPITRQCQGSFLYGAAWSNVTGHCVENPLVSAVTEKLKKMAELPETRVEDVWRIVGKAQLTLLDVYYLNIILSKLRETDSYALDFVDKLMVTDKSVLKVSQARLNLTDNILQTLEDLLTNVSLNPESVYFTRKNNLIVHVTNPFQSNVSGLLLYGAQEQLFGEFSIHDFERGKTFEDVKRENLDLAVYVPEAILRQLQNETNNTVSDIVVITVVFHNDNFFVDDNYNANSFVVSVSIPGYGSYLKSPIPIIFNSPSDNASRTCGFWDHGSKINRKKGKWSVLGGNYAQLNDSLHSCSFVHLTHFALLLMSDKANAVDSVEQIEEMILDHDLEIITIIGSSLSIFGIVGIFTTALMYEKWRSKIGTKILMNLSIAIFLELICIHLSEIREVKVSPTVCKIVGMILHYVVLSKFAWMLIYAFLQYYRFVQVIGVIPKKLILKSVIVGWGIPLAFVSFVALLPGDYVSSTYDICYPRGLLLHLAVILPISLIMVANTVIFCMVMYNVTHTTNSGGSKKLFRLRLYLALLLFSVLGVPWIFGIVAELLGESFMKTILFYLFCITATIQGFVLFLFYVVLNTETRNYWRRFFAKFTCYHCN